MTLLDGQYSYRGFVLGAKTPYGVKRVTGLEDLTVRSTDRERPRGHGSVPGPRYVAAKDIVFDLVLRGSPESLAAELAALRAAFTVEDEGAPEPLVFKRPGMPERLIHVAPNGLAHAEEAPRAGVVANPRIALAAANPRIYASAGRSLTITRYDPGQDRAEYPGDYAKEFGGEDGLEGVAVNAGSADAWPLVRFYGPTDGGTVTSVTLRNLTTGQTQTVVTPVGVDQILTVDNEAWVTGSGDPVVALDGSTRYGDWQQPRLPLALPPGESVLRYETEGTAVEPKCVVTWRDTWIP